MHCGPPYGCVATELIETNAISKTWLAIYSGIDPAEFTGTADEFYKAVGLDDREMLKAALARTIEQNVPYEVEY